MRFQIVSINKEKSAFFQKMEPVVKVNQDRLRRRYNQYSAKQNQNKKKGKLCSASVYRDLVAGCLLSAPDVNCCNSCAVVPRRSETSIPGPGQEGAFKRFYCD